MKTRLFLFSLFCGFQLTAQFRIPDGTALLDLQRLPMEKAYVHPSQTLLFSGEYLYYTFYGINAQTSKLSRISHMGYVSLIDSDGQQVFEHKVLLDGGIGQGEYFVNTDLPTGAYTLVGYTQWMKNGGLEQVFKAPLAIVNPYQIPTPGPEETEEGASLEAVTAQKPAATPDPGVALLFLEPDSTHYAPRSQVRLRIRNYKGPLGHGTYSLAVARRPELPAPGSVGAEAFGQHYLNADKILPQGIGDSIYLPEQRGELLFGKVTDSNTGDPAAGVEVILSIPGTRFILTSATTDQSGHFYSYLRKAYAYPAVICQVLDAGEYRVEQGRRRPMPWSELDNPDWKLSEADREAIVARSVHNQLENAFFGVKPDSVLVGDTPDPFDGGLPREVVLDEYTRFPTLQETFVELLGYVGYRKAPDGSDYIRVAQDFETFNEPYNSDPAIVLIDGVFIRDPGTIKNFDASQIQTIRVLQDALVLGSQTYQGVVSIETFNGNFPDTFQTFNGARFPLEFPKAVKRYFRMDYGATNAWQYARVPDYRYLLHWEPRIEVDGPEVELTFFTSDLEGTYELVLEGFTTYGKPVTVRGRIEVQK